MSALVHVRSIPELGEPAKIDIQILRAALIEMSRFWSSAKVLATGMDKVLGIVKDRRVKNATQLDAGARAMEDLEAEDGVHWCSLYEFATTDTSGLAAAILNNCKDNEWLASLPDIDWDFDFDMLSNDLSATYDDSIAMQ